MLLLVLAFACVLYLVVDLDRAHQGLLRVSQQSMIDLQQTMKAQQPSRLLRVRGGDEILLRNFN
jgi:hypothetical protein